MRAVVFKGPREIAVEDVEDPRIEEPDQAGTPLSDGDHVAGAPSQESGDVQEGSEVGPDMRVRNAHHRSSRTTR